MSKLPRWLRWRSREELDEELTAHLDSAMQAGIERGLTPDEARYAALRELGNMTRVKERAREGDPLFWIESIAKDVRYAARSLARNRSFTIVAVLSLGLGIGANSAVFSFWDAIAFRPLPVPRASEIVRVFSSAPEQRLGFLSYREYTALSGQNQTLGALTAEQDDFFAIQGRADDLARFAYGDYVSGNYFSVLEVPAGLGRTFNEQEDTPGMREIPVVLSHQAWEAKFHSDPAIVGSELRINSQFAAVIGVLPESFTGTLRGAMPELYLPLHAMARIDPSRTSLSDPLNRPFSLLGRLKPGAKLKQAQAGFAALGVALERAYPDSERQRSFVVLTDLNGRFQLSPGYEAAAITMLITSFVVLWMACINVANLLLGRAGVRVKEITIRLSVGASRRRVIGQLLTESALLASLGAAAGLLLASWAIHLLASIRIPSDIPIVIAARMDGRVLLYSMAAMVISVFLFGLAPAFRATKVDLVSPVKEGSGRRPRHRLVTVQAALSVVTLVLAGLLAKNSLAAAGASPGFRVQNVLLMTFDPSMTGYSQEQTRNLYRQIQERVRALPGVRQAALGSHVQLGENYDAAVFYRDSENLGDIAFNRVEPGFFDTMATPIVRGRAIDDRDTERSPRVAVVNETLARRWFASDKSGGSDALGRRIRLYSENGPEAQIVGIARDGKYTDLSEPPAPYVYIPYAQDFQARMTLFVWSAGDPAALTSPIREQVKAIAPNLVVFDVRTMQNVFEGLGLIKVRLGAQMSGAMGLMGLALTMLGLYAVMAFLVSRKTREIGIRLALGATRGVVLRQMLRAGLSSTLLGIGMGLVAALVLTHYLSTPFRYVSPRDPEIFIGAPVFLLLIALAACWAPARRASRVDPAVTLRYE